MKEKIICFRSFLLKHFKSKSAQTLIYGLISYEIISYLFFGIGTSIVDYLVYTALNATSMNLLISNSISTTCAIIFAFVTNKLWVFKSDVHGIKEILQEFFKFVEARLITYIMTQFILTISMLIYGNEPKANLIAKLIAMILTVIINYIISKLFIFENRKDTNNEK